MYVQHIIIIAHSVSLSTNNIPLVLNLFKIRMIIVCTLHKGVKLSKYERKGYGI